MKDVFISVENNLDETFKQNEHLKDQLLEASLAGDVKNLVITSCMEIRNKNLHDEMERISKESKDVSNESTTADTVCNDAFEVTQELSNRIVELEKDLSKFDTTLNEEEGTGKREQWRWGWVGLWRGKEVFGLQGLADKALKVISIHYIDGP
ncbi:hypothetical protein Tco_0429470 [Tanacetum coccineum]